MEIFEINLAGDRLKVLPNSDNSYTILKGDDRIAVIYSEESEELGTIWKSDDEINEMFVKQVGELIMEREL